jgi:hypothetical protein
MPPWWVLLLWPFAHPFLCVAIAAACGVLAAVQDISRRKQRDAQLEDLARRTADRIVQARGGRTS